MNYLNNGGTFLVDAIFGLFIFCILIRFWMHMNNADFRNPIGHFLVQISNPLLSPFKKVLLTNKNFAMATFAIAFVLTVAKLFILFSMNSRGVSIPSLLLFASADIIQSSVYILLGAMIIRVISSWIAPQGAYNPFISVVYSITEPLMAPARRIIPTMSGIDLSPIIVFLFLQLSLIVIIPPIRDLAASL